MIYKFFKGWFYFVSLFFVYKTMVMIAEAKADIANGNGPAYGAAFIYLVFLPSFVLIIVISLLLATFVASGDGKNEGSLVMNNSEVKKSIFSSEMAKMVTLGVFFVFSAIAVYVAFSL